MEKRSIGVIGSGFVGSQVIRWFGGKRRVAWCSRTGGSFEAVNRCGIVFLCLPTPASASGFDVSAIRQNLKRLTPPKIIVLKSTVLPGTTRFLAKKFPRFRFLFNPEFLREKTARKDFEQPERQLVGYTKRSRKAAARLMDLLPRGEFSAIIRSDEAEMAKLAGNCYLALRVVFANQIYDYCRKVGVDYKKMIELVKRDSRIGTSHWNILQDGYRGYAGHCFPKDMAAVIADSRSPLLARAHYLNRKYRDV